MIDQPQLTVPREHVGVSWRPVHIGQQAIQPYDLRGQLMGQVRHRWVERDSARQIMQRQVGANAGFKQVLYFFIRLRSPKGAVQVCKYQDRR